MNSNIGIIIQARTSSTRLPKKIILKMDGEETFLDVLLKRVKKLKTKYPVILATSNLKVDEVLLSFAESHEIKFFQGSENNVLNRFIECAKENKLKTIVRVCSDNPFLDINLLEELIANYNNEDYLSYKINNSPSILTHFGFFAEIVSVKALEKVAEKGDETCNEHVTNCIYKNPDDFIVNFIHKKNDNNSIRCTLDTKNDFENLKDIYLNFVKENPEYRYPDLIKYIETRTDLLLEMKKIIKENTK